MKICNVALYTEHHRYSPIKNNTNPTATNDDVERRFLVAFDNTGRDANRLDIDGRNLIEGATNDPRVRFVIVNNVGAIDVRGTTVEGGCGSIRDAQKDLNRALRMN